MIGRVASVDYTFHTGEVVAAVKYYGFDLNDGFCKDRTILNIFYNEKLLR